MYERINDFVLCMTQTPRGLVVELATIYTLTIKDVFMAVHSKGTSLRSVVSVILHHRKFGQQSGHSSSLLSAPR